MIPLLLIAGGVALLLFGVRFLRKGLDRLFGQRLGSWMNRLASTRLSSFLCGAGASFLAPSSTTISLLAVQTVQAGQLTARQMLAVMLGANIGLTIMVQLIALSIDRYAPIAILVGVGLFQYTRLPRARGIGQVILSLGFIFLAMGVIRGAVTDANLPANDDFVQIVSIAEHYPVILLIVAALTAMMLQSSTATIGLVIGLGSAGALSLPVVIPVVLGANIGLSLTTLTMGWRQVPSRRLAGANLLLKTITAGIVMVAAAFVGRRLPEPTADAMPFVVANLHTAFNVLVAIIGLPAIGLVTALLERLVPTPSAERSAPFAARFVHAGPIDSMALALGQSLREILHMAEILRGMLDDVWTALKNDDPVLAREVSTRDDHVDALDAAIKRFLTRLVREEAGDRDAREQMRQLRYLTELETIGDVIDRNLAELVLKKIRLGARFSDPGSKELDDFHGQVVLNLETAVNAMARHDRTLAQQVMRNKSRLRDLAHELRDRHFQRLNAGLVQSHETSAIHLDLLTHLNRINSALAHVAHAMLSDAAAAVEPRQA